jgi:hypothetical protein
MIILATNLIHREEREKRKNIFNQTHKLYKKYVAALINSSIFGFKQEINRNFN